MDKVLRQFEADHPTLTDSSLKALRKKLLIEKYALDDAAVAQPTTYYQVSDRVARIESLRDAAKFELEDTEALVSSRIRKIGTKDGKLTENAIRERVISTPEYKIAYRRFLFLKELASRWQVLRSAFEQRASMLKILAGLYSSSYFSTDGVTGSSKEFRDAANKDNRHRLNLARKNRSSV